MVCVHVFGLILIDDPLLRLMAWSSVCLAGVCMAGRASTATSASPIQAVCMAPVWSRGSASATPTGAATFAIKVNCSLLFQLLSL